MSDVTPYAAVSQSCFDSGTARQAGVIKMKKDALVKSNSSETGSSVVVIYKNQSIGYISVSGDFYKVLVGNRVGYIQKSDCL